MEFWLPVLFLNHLVLGQIIYRNGYALSSLQSMYPSRAADLEVSNSVAVFPCLIRCIGDLMCMTILYKNGNCHLYYQGYVENTTAMGPAPGWIHFNVYKDGCPVNKGYVHSRALGICYKLYLGGPRNVYDFMATCTSDGGELLKITSQAIQDHIAAFLADATCNFIILIQGSDRNSEGTFLFEDSSALPYSNWLQGEPNNYLNNEHFIFLLQDTGYIWADGSDVETSLSSFICEIVQS